MTIILNDASDSEHSEIKLLDHKGSPSFSPSLPPLPKMFKIHKVFLSLICSSLFWSPSFSNVCQIYSNCANNLLQLKSSQLKHETAGSCKIYRDCRLHTFTLVKRDSKFLHHSPTQPSLAFRILNIKFQSEAVCYIYIYIYLYMHTFKINQLGINT